MANVLDLRRRIRSVQNTRQITKAMKLVSAARLRRAQERALAARPYSQMLVNVLKSLVSRAEIYDPITGEPRHALLERREEKNILLVVVSGDKGFAGAFNANVIKTANRFLEAKAGKNVDIIASAARDATCFAGASRMRSRLAMASSTAVLLRSSSLASKSAFSTSSNSAMPGIWPKRLFSAIRAKKSTPCTWFITNSSRS